MEKTPKEIIDFTLTLGIDSFYVGYSGGKDSGIVLDLIAREYPKYFKGVIYINTGIGTDATLNFVKNFCKQKNYTLFELTPNAVSAKGRSKYLKKGEHYNYQNLIKCFGFPDASWHNTTMAWLKYYPMKYFINDRIALGENPALISGVRKNESSRRKFSSKYTRCPLDKSESIIFVKPIYYKTNTWVSEYWIKNNLKRSPCYDTIATSGDCLCGCFSDSHELKLLELYHPEVFNKIKELEQVIQKVGTHRAKKYAHWGNSDNTSTTDIQNQTTLDFIEESICNECHFDKKINPLLRFEKKELDIMLNENHNQKKLLAK